eukprot:evm.model.NODE_28269_length_9764_cov_34.789738.3
MVPFARIVMVLGMHSHELYSGAFFFSNIVTAVAWTCSWWVVRFEAASQESTYHSWTLLCFWVLSLISDGFILAAASPGLKAYPHPSIALLGQGILNVIAFASGGGLVLLGFLAPKQTVVDADVMRGMCQSPAEVGVASDITALGQGIFGSPKWSEAGRGKWWRQRWWWQKWTSPSSSSARGLDRPGTLESTSSGGVYSSLSETSFSREAESLSNTTMLGTPSVILRQQQQQQQQQQAGGQPDDQQSASYAAPSSAFYQSFLKAHASFVPGSLSVTPTSFDVSSAPLSQAAAAAARGVGGGRVGTAVESGAEPAGGAEEGDMGPGRATGGGLSPPTLLSSSFRQAASTSTLNPRRPRRGSLGAWGNISGGSGSGGGGGGGGEGGGKSVYHISIPRWLLVDPARNPVEVEPLLEEEGVEEGREEGMEALPPDASSMCRRRTSILPDVCDKKVAFEIAVEREGGREEGNEDEDEDEEEGGRKGWHREGWTVWRTYEDFDNLHAALMARFFPEGGREGGGEGGCPLERPTYIGLREGRLKEQGQGKVLLRVVDVVSDMRSLRQYLSQAMALRLQSRELREFLVDEEEEEEEGREKGVVVDEVQEGEEGPKKKKKEEEEEEGKEGGKKGMALRQVYLAMRKSIAAEEHHVRLRTFKVRREGEREGGREGGEDGTVSGFVRRALC